MNLFELSQQYHDVEVRFYQKMQELGEDADELQVYQDTLESLHLAKEQKIEAYIYMIQAKKREAEAYKKKAQQFRSAARSNEKTIDWMKHELLMQVNENGGNRIQTDNYTLWRVPTQSVQADVAKLPAEYVVTKTTTSADKNALKKALKAGEQIDGATLENGYYVRMK